ncbi:MAG: TonB-dependent receptor [Terriglobia bacterium]|nr:MAG: TonB-dependent receptor [Terriglobia bacterium]
MDCAGIYNKRRYGGSFMKRPSLLFVLMIWLPAILSGQAQVSSGDLTGTILDAKGAAIRGARVTASAPERGLSRSVQSGELGDYRIPLLPPGAYRVRAEAPGFSTRVTEGVAVQVGETVTLNIQLEVGAVTTEVTVAAETPVIEPQRTQQASTIEFQRIENLPINRRNYLDFALLSPGVVETNDLVDSTDYRVVQTPQSGVSFGAGNGRGNNFTIDGVENYYNSGGVRPSVSQEVVQEFQINRNSVTAEFGNSFGGTINIISRSGSNEVHGDVFGFLRHRDIQARNFFDPAKSAFTRAQYGATAGGPIARDKTFFFAGFERLDRHESSFVPILQDRSSFSSLTQSQQQLANFFAQAPVPSLQVLAPLMRRYLTTTNFPATLALFNNNSGVFPFSEFSNQVSARVDHHFSPNNNFFIRTSFTDGRNQNIQVGALVGFNRGRSLSVWDGTVMVSNTQILNPQWISETRLMFNYDKLSVIPTDPYGPDITISGYGSFGREIFLPSTSYERHLQFQQNIQHTTGRHNLKAGFDANPTRDHAVSETFFGGRFAFGAQVPLGALLPLLSGDPNATTAVATALTALGQQALIPNLSQPITALQAYNLGLPTLYQQGFGDPNWIAWFKRFGFFVQDDWKITPRFTLNLGARYDVEGEPSPLNTDTNNIAPRIGFAWSPFANGKTILRGGYGLYYAQINAQIANLPAALNGIAIAQIAITPLGIPGLLNPRTGQPLTSFDVYQTLLAQGVIGHRTITVQDLAQFNLHPGPNAAGQVLFGITKDYVNPYAQQASFEVEHAFGSVAFSAGYEFNRGMRLPRILDRNIFYTGRTASGQPTFGFYRPAVLQNNIEESTASSFYHALMLQASKRFSHHVSVNANYTFSKMIDDVTDFNSDFEPQDQLNARADRALSSFDQRHRFVLSAVLESPAKDKWLRGFTLAPIIQASAGRPFNILTGFDNFGDNHPTTHRPFGAGRNIGQGPDFFTWDLRLARRFPFSMDGRRNVEFTAEGFNMLNHTNFKSVNNTVGTLSLAALPRPIAGHAGVPTEPLAFTSAFDPRQFQFGLKINF